MISAATIFLRSTIREVDMLLLGPEMANSSPSPFFLIFTEAALNVVSPVCVAMVGWNPSWRDLGLCSAIWAGHALFHNELRCLESLTHPVVQPDGCFYLFKPSSHYNDVDFSVLERRDNVFRHIIRRYRVFLAELDYQVNIALANIDHIQRLVEAVRDAHTAVKTLTNEAKNIVIEEDEKISSNHEKLDLYWKNRSYLVRALHLIQRKEQTLIDLTGVAKRKGTSRISREDQIHILTCFV